MTVTSWLEKQAPDFLRTGRRFPLAILLLALATIAFLGSINFSQHLSWDVWHRVVLGLGTGAVVAAAGVYFAESRPRARLGAAALKYALPIAVAAAFQVTDTAWLIPWALPACAFLWLSVSPFTRVERGVPRQAQQDRFWWLNHQAVTTALIALVAFLLISLGFWAIERSLSVLFGFNAADLFYRWLLPFTGAFLVPLYWLSTLPRVSEFQPQSLEHPDFLARAIGFLGQFVLVPLLLIYSLILLAYTVQIVVTQHLPEGMIGWMVLGFVVTGAAAWLVLYPPFMRQRALVRLFCRLWFWLTAIPLVLFFAAVWVRVDAYGLTEQRVLLLAGGLWAALLAAIFLVRRGDIRLIPGLAGAVLLVLSVGPWNYSNLPVEQQLMRVDALLMVPGVNGATTPPSWTAEQQARARGALTYLFYDEMGRKRLTQLLERRGLDKRWADPNGIMLALGYPEVKPSYGGSFTARRDDLVPVDVSTTPLLIGSISAYEGGEDKVLGLSAGQGWSGAVALRLTGLALEVVDGAQVLSSIDLASLTDTQTPTISAPTLDFAIHGTKMRIVIDRIEIAPGLAEEPPRLSSLYGTLFASAPTPSP